MQIDEMMVSFGNTTTSPNNYFSIYEMPTEKGVHRMLRINELYN
jgi:hypothetical protein